MSSRTHHRRPTTSTWRRGGFALAATAALVVGGASVAPAQAQETLPGSSDVVNELIDGALTATGAPGPHRIRGVYFTSPGIPAEAASLEAQGIALIGPGTPVGIGENVCTIGAAGHDAAGRAIAITAGHCGAVGKKVQSLDSPKVGDVGTVVSVNQNPDYAVIQLGSNVKVTSHYGAVNADSIGAPTTVLGTQVCKNGISTGFSCGPAYGGEIQGELIAQICATHGDSGAPLLEGNRIIGLIDRGLFPGSCVHPAQGMLFSPTVSVSIQAVLDSMNAHGGPGAGFRLA